MDNDELRAERLVRVRFACQRTSQALNQPLNQFLVEHYENISRPQQFAFERLLSASDQDILDWLQGAKQPHDQGIREILSLIHFP